MDMDRIVDSVRLSQAPTAVAQERRCGQPKLCPRRISPFKIIIVLIINLVSLFDVHLEKDVPSDDDKRK